MTFLRLEAGTDVAIMTLFDVDALPRTAPPDNEGLDRLASERRLVRFDTGGDGGYLLHLFVDEPVPERIRQYCLPDERSTGELCFAEGRVAFGGAESAYRDFKPNRHIRSDASIAAGNYHYVAWHTDIPEDVMDEAMRVARTPAERWLSRVPPFIVMAALGLAVVLAILRHVVAAGLVLAAGWLLLRAVTRSAAYLAVEARREEAQRDFPGMVVELRRAGPGEALPTIKTPA